MDLAEKAKLYYSGNEKNCAEAILLASGDKYKLGLTEEDAKLLVGFGGGMGCGSICGALAGSIAVLGKMFSSREGFRNMCADFTEAFTAGMGCSSADCSVLAKRYKTDEKRCEQAVITAAGILEGFIAEVSETKEGTADRG